MVAIIILPGSIPSLIPLMGRREAGKYIQSLMLKADSDT